MDIGILFAFYPLFVRYNHGIALLSSLCKAKGIQTELYVLNDIESFSTYLDNCAFEHVGFSCVTDQDYQRTIPFISAAARAGKTILLGGVYARRNRNIVDEVDYICRGEGESLPDFLLNGDESIFRVPFYCKDLNELPLPDYELFKDIPFDRGMPFLEGKKVLPYYSSRGCPYHCSFCLVKNQPRGVRVRRLVKQDLSIITKKYSPDLIFIGDELLPYYDVEWRDSWNDFYYPFMSYIRADIHPDILIWLISRGLECCSFGIESGDENHRNDILKKSLTDSEIFRTVEILKKYDIPFAPFYMTNTPGETFSIRLKTDKMRDDVGGYPLTFVYENLS